MANKFNLDEWLERFKKYGLLNKLVDKLPDIAEKAAYGATKAYLEEKK